MSQDNFGDRLKAYEKIATSQRLNPLQPIYARIDGRNFSRFTHGLERPYDPRMTEVMIMTAIYLVAQTHARIGYTQSDEISLIWLAKGEEAQAFFDGKIQKLCSVLAAMATTAFMQLLFRHPNPEFITYSDRLPHFDARVFNVPNKQEGANLFLWREMDATRNAIQMVAHDNFSHKTLHKVNTEQMREMIKEKGIDWSTFPSSFTRGTYMRRVTFQRPFTPEELARIPPDYHPPENMVTRSKVSTMDMPPFLQVKNRVGVIFDGEDPQLDTPA